MKKTVKKLRLTKETVRGLEEREVHGVAGAYSDAYTACCYPDQYSYYCPSVRVVCKYPPTTY
jgi:hypothetical protein